MAQIENTVTVACSPETLFEYVTQPAKWHEWHPNSLSAVYPQPLDKVGLGFDEVIAVQALPGLPLRLKRDIQYRVTDYEKNKLWAVVGEGKDSRIRIHYEFEPHDDGCLFRRHLSYELVGWVRWLRPLLERNNRVGSRRALENLVSRF